MVKLLINIITMKFHKFFMNTEILLKWNFTRNTLFPWHRVKLKTGKTALAQSPKEFIYEILSNLVNGL